jgi:two-component system chemotaxis sensor kinase CheA
MNEEFRKRLETTFHEEAAEHLHRLGSGLIEWERSGEGGRDGLAESLYRAAHSLKGAARAVLYGEMEALCQALEGSLQALKAGARILAPELFDTLNAARGRLEEMLAARRRGLQPLGQDPVLLQSLRDIEHAGPAKVPPSPPAQGSMHAASGSANPSRKPQAGTEPKLGASELRDQAEAESRVRLPMKKLQSLHERLDDLTAVKLQADRLLLLLEEMQRAAAELSAGLDKEFGKASRTRKGGQELLKLAGSLDELGVQARRLGRGHRDDLDAVSGYLHAGVRDVLMFPVGDLLEVFPKLARDLAMQTGKRVRMTISGADREMEKPVAEELREILLHLVRNAIDHGIETPEERLAHGKTAEGNLSLSVDSMPGGKVRIEFRDDGRGLDPARLRDAAVRNGLLPPAEAETLADAQALQLAFRSGITTRGEVSALSGRGLGLAIVRERAEKRGGSAAVESAPGAGTRFILILPSRLSASRGLVVAVGDRKYVVLTSQVRQVMHYAPGQGRAGKWPPVQAGGAWLDVTPLSRILGLPGQPKARGNTGAVLILGVDGSARAVYVESVHGEQEIVVKALGPAFGKPDNIAGAVTLITGETALLAELGEARSWNGDGDPAESATEMAAGPRKVLVVEDSITSRTLIKSLLETAGYSVAIAVDGIAAMAAMEQNEFDIIVSDVEMPRMGGFELLSRIRTEEKWRSLPVVLVTSLDSDAERARGLAFGANAYMAKGEFDAGRLLEILGGNL